MVISYATTTFVLMGTAHSRKMMVSMRLKTPTVPSLALSVEKTLKLMLYCGVRPAEITRINPERDIVDDMLIIRPHCSKTGGGRIIPLRKVADFLKRHSERKIIPANWQQKRKALRQAADFRYWKPDICRHTFATYHARHFKNLSVLQLEMGHRSPALLQTRYISAVPLPHAADFWR